MRRKDAESQAHTSEASTEALALKESHALCWEALIPSQLGVLGEPPVTEHGLTPARSHF